jgi:hypothetical protein
MSFNLGVQNHPGGKAGFGFGSVGIYLYEDIFYRQWISEIALAFYEGRQDEFIWLDLLKQFRNPEKQQIWPVNLTKEIIDEISILYREQPIYKVVDEDGKVLKKDQKLWEKVQRDSRYHTTMERLDRWTRLLGTVLVKVSFVDPNTGKVVEENKGGKVQLDLLQGGTYDVRYGTSPYFISELMIGFGRNFNGFGSMSGGVQTSVPGSHGGGGGVPTGYGAAGIEARIKHNSPADLHNVNRIYWSPTDHFVEDDEGGQFKTKNPYGIIPAVPFFNQDPAHYYFLPIDEPLIYANHAINMRITDLNHIAKFQSFGIPVLKGGERSTSLRQGRPTDDFNVLLGGGARPRFGGLGANAGFTGAQFRTFDHPLGALRDGNADANALGMSIGPDTAITVGEKGDFKFANPSADITGLIKVIQDMSDVVRINHGLRPKYKEALPSSGFALLMEKIGVIEDNIRRGRLFKEREQQLFQVIKTLWNSHHSKSGSEKFSENARLEVTYVEPEFPVDPATKKNDLILEQQIVDSGDSRAVKEIYEHLEDPEIKKIITTRRKEKREAELFEAETQRMIQEEQMKLEQELAPPEPEPAAPAPTAKPKMDNRVKHSEESSKQKGKNGDPRKKSKDAKKEEKK